MAIQDIINLRVKFDLPVSPFFSIQDTTDYASEGIDPSDVAGIFTINNPTGQIYENVDFGNPDISPSISAYFNLLGIPLDGGHPVYGDYSFQYSIQVTGAIQPGTYIYTQSFTYNYVSPTVTILFDNNPYVTLLSSRDVTEYIITGITPTIIRAHTLFFPQLTETPEIVTTASYIAVTTPFYFTGEYRSTVNSELNYSFENYDVHDIVDGSKDILVEDTIDIQSIYCCLKKLNDKITTAQQNGNITAYELNTKILSRATQLLELFNKAVQFSRYTDANLYIQQIYDVTGCTPGCTCGGTSQTSIQPYWQTVNIPGETPDPEFQVGDLIVSFRTSKNSKWIPLEGQILQITSYQEYYDVVGTMFNQGGEPSGYFRNEDGRSRSIIGAGQGAGLSNRVLGAIYGVEAVSGNHSHTISVSASGNTPVIPVSVPIGSKALVINPFTPAGTVAITNIVLSPHVISNITMSVSGNTGTGVTGSAQPSITGTGTINLPLDINDIGYTPAGTISITPFTPAGSVTLSAYTPSGTVTVNSTSGLIVDFTNIDNHTDTIVEDAPGHKHNVTIPAAGTGAEATNLALAGTYATTDTQVSIDLASQPLVHTGTQNIDHTHTASFAGAVSTQTGSFSGSLASPTGSFGGTPALIPASGTVDLPISDIADNLEVGAHTHTIPSLSVTGSGTIGGFIPDHTFVSGTATFTGVQVTLTGTVNVGTINFNVPATPIELEVDGSTDAATLNLSILHPVFAANYFVKIRL